MWLASREFSNMAKFLRLAILFALCMSVEYTACHSGHHRHAHLHHRDARGEQSAVATPSVSHVVQQASPTSLSIEDAQSMIQSALAVISKLNRARLEKNGASNNYGLQNATSRREASVEAPLLGYSTPKESGTSKRQRRGSIEDSTNSNGVEYSYSLPPELIEAARIVTEASPPGPTKGNPEAVASRIHQKYSSKMNDTNAPLQKLQQPNGLSMEIPSDAQMPIIAKDTDDDSSSLTKRAPSTYWMATMKQRGTSPFAPEGYKVKSEDDLPEGPTLTTM